MKHLKYIITAVAVALFAASCSQDDYLAEDGGDTPVTGQTQAYTFTVSPSRLAASCRCSIVANLSILLLW